MKYAKDLLLSLSTLICIASTYAMDDPKESASNPSMPYYAKFISHSSAQQFQDMIVNAMDILGDQILHPLHVDTMSIIRVKPDQFFADRYIPDSIKEEHQRKAIKTIITHYNYIHYIREILTSVLTHELHITKSSIIPEGWQKKEMKAPPKALSPDIVFWEATQPAVSSSEAAAAVEAAEDHPRGSAEETKGKSVFYAQIDCTTGWLSSNYRSGLFFYFDVVLDEDVFNLRTGPFTPSLHEIRNASSFLSSYSKILAPGSQLNDVLDIYSAGAELKDALDSLLGTKHVMGNPHPFMGPIHGQDSYDQRRLEILRETVKALNEEVSDASTPAIKEALELQMRLKRAKCKGLEVGLQVLAKKAESLPPINQTVSAHNQVLIDQAFARDALLASLKKASELFIEAVAEGEGYRILYNKKRFID